MNLRSLIAAAAALVLVSCVQNPAFARQVKPIECVLGNVAGQLVIPKPCLRVIDAARSHNRKLKVRKAPNGFDISASRRRAHARPFRISHLRGSVRVHRARGSGVARAAVARETFDNDGRVRVVASEAQSRDRVSVPVNRVREALTRSVRRAARVADRPASTVHIGGGLTRVCEGNACGTVVAHAAEKFRGLFRDLVALGYNLGSPGCYSPTGHMRNSLHHWGGACDLFNQVGRNITALRQPSPSVQVELAAKHGLTSGCAWRSPDCGHFDLSGIGMAGGASRRYVAKRYYYARHRRPPLRLSGATDHEQPQWVWLYCTAVGCHHYTATTTAAWIIRWGPDDWARMLRRNARCSSCGARGVKTTHPSWGGMDSGWTAFPVQHMRPI